MALTDRLDKRPVSRHGLPCSVGQLLQTLEGEELEALQIMLGDPHKRDGWTATDIWTALTAEGYKVGYQTINRHRGGKCRCNQGGDQ